MCGRMTLSRRELAELADELDALPVAGAADAYRPRFNVAPTDTHPIVRLDATGERNLEPAIWGFAPTGPGRPPLFNARAETAPIKDSFRGAFVNGRCVVPADGFYEWAGTGDARRPYWLHRADGKLLTRCGALCGASVPRKATRTRSEGVRSKPSNGPRSRP
jgi:putative SOS response-associated peptidase YedK